MFKIKLKQPKDGKDGKDGKVEKPKIKLNLSKPQQKAFDKPKKVPRIRVKPTRIPGEGYDSEDSEIEDDPLLEEGIVVRLLPDAELDYVRHCVETGDFSNIHMKWRDKRRCIIKVNNSLYAAKLIQLPNIIEVQKSVDRKNMFKTIDISQILLVVKKIDSEEEINELQVGDNEVFDHGLTPPLHNVMKSETRRKTDTSYIHSLEAKVDELLRLDEEALDSTFELIDPENVRLEDNTVVQTPMVPIVEDEEPAIDELELELEQALGEDEMEVDEPEQEEEEDEEESDDDDDDESDNEQGVSRKVEVDENEQHNALLRDEIYELQQTIEQNKARLEKTHNPLLQSRFIDSIKKLENELENKKRQLKTGEDKKKRDDAVKEAEEQSGVGVEEEEEEEEEQEEEQRQEEEEDEGEEDEGDDDLDDLFS